MLMLMLMLMLLLDARPFVSQQPNYAVPGKR